MYRNHGYLDSPRFLSAQLRAVRSIGKATLTAIADADLALARERLLESSPTAEPLDWLVRLDLELVGRICFRSGVRTLDAIIRGIARRFPDQSEIDLRGSIGTISIRSHEALHRLLESEPIQEQEPLATLWSRQRLIKKAISIEGGNRRDPALEIARVVLHDAKDDRAYAIIIGRHNIQARHLVARQIVARSGPRERAELGALQRALNTGESLHIVHENATFQLQVIEVQQYENGFTVSGSIGLELANSAQRLRIVDYSGFDVVADDIGNRYLWIPTWTTWSGTGNRVSFNVGYFPVLPLDCKNLVFGSSETLITPNFLVRRWHNEIKFGPAVLSIPVG
jgi:hypothetical protein